MSAMLWIGLAATRDMPVRFDSLVLVWQRNPKPPVVHRNERCLTLSRSKVPDQSVAFGGSGTAGWLLLQEAERLPNMKLCGHCM